MKILNSASRIVFVLVAVSVSIFTFMGLVEAKDFMMLASMTFGYYYGSKTPSSSNNS